MGCTNVYTLQKFPSILELQILIQVFHLHKPLILSIYERHQSIDRSADRDNRLPSEKQEADYAHEEHLTEECVLYRQITSGSYFCRAHAKKNVMVVDDHYTIAYHLISDAQRRQWVGCACDEMRAMQWC